MKNYYVSCGDVTAIYMNFKGQVVKTFIDTKNLSKADAFSGTWVGTQYKKNGAIYATGISAVNTVKTYWKLHRLISLPKPEENVDHRDHDGLNNLESNLRNCTPHENSQNTPPNPKNTSGFRGVSYRKDRKKWRAYVTVNRKQKSLGHYDTAEEANEVATRYREELLPFSVTTSSKRRGKL